MIDATELSRLRELAQKATPGPWYTTGSPWFSSADGVLAGSPDPHVAFMIADCDDGMNPRDEYDGMHKLSDPDDDAAHIAAFDPSTVIVLIDELEAARARVAKLEAALKDVRIDFEMWHEKTSIAKIDAALKDASQ